jgi:hypothetical protein
MTLEGGPNGAGSNRIHLVASFTAVAGLRRISDTMSRTMSG